MQMLGCLIVIFALFCMAAAIVAVAWFILFWSIVLLFKLLWVMALIGLGLWLVLFLGGVLRSILR